MTEFERNLERVRQGIERLEAALYHHRSESFSRILQTELPEGIARHLQDVFSSPAYADNRSSQEELLEKLKKGLKLVRTVRMEFAFEPSELLIEKITDWVRQEAGDTVVLDAGVEPSLLGGARISYNGRYEEYTLHRLIERALSAKQKEILSLINSGK